MGVVPHPNWSYFWGVNLSPSPRRTATTHGVSLDRTAYGKSSCSPGWGPSTLSLGLRVRAGVEKRPRTKLPFCGTLLVSKVEPAEAV